jgi:hypothetical protein
MVAADSKDTAGRFHHIYLFLDIFLYFLAGWSVLATLFAYGARFVLWRDVWIRTQRAAVASRCDSILATHLPVKQFT